MMNGSKVLYEIIMIVCLFTFILIFKHVVLFFKINDHLITEIYTLFKFYDEVQNLI
jgi:hypothetical protein